MNSRTLIIALLLFVQGLSIGINIGSSGKSEEQKEVIANHENKCIKQNVMMGVERELLMATGDNTCKLNTH